MTKHQEAENQVGSKTGSMATRSLQGPVVRIVQGPFPLKEVAHYLLDKILYSFCDRTQRETPNETGTMKGDATTSKTICEQLNTRAPTHSHVNSTPGLFQRGG